MPKAMKAAIVRKFKEPLSIEEAPVPEVGRGQILVKNEACGVCHTDLHAADGDWPVSPSRPSYLVTKALESSPLWAGA